MFYIVVKLPYVLNSNRGAYSQIIQTKQIFKLF